MWVVEEDDHLGTGESSADEEEDEKESGGGMYEEMLMEQEVAFAKEREIMKHVMAERHSILKEQQKVKRG